MGSCRLAKPGDGGFATASSDGGVKGGDASCSMLSDTTLCGRDGGGVATFIAMTLDAIDAFWIAFNIDTA